MFDYVISKDHKRRPAKRIFSSFMISILAHGFALFLLIEYPELLKAPGRWDFSQIWRHPKREDSQGWRTVATLPSKMTLPSAAALKKLLSDMERKGSGTNPRIRLNGIKPAASNPALNPKAPMEARNNRPPSRVPEAVSTSPAPVKPEPGNPGLAAGNPGAANAPPSEPPPKPAIVENAASTKIPEPGPAITKPTPASASNVKPAPDNAGLKIRMENPDRNNNGFPMGEYTDRIAELIKEKWLIPSYLKDSQGRTTVSFNIEKDGRTMNVRLLSGSGSRSLDIAALSAVQSCNLPALPKGFPRDRFGVRVDFSYNEHQ
jgi:TonB family protein